MDEPYNKCGSGITGTAWGCWYTEIKKPTDATGLQYALKPYFDKEANLSGQFPQLIHSGAASQHIGLSYDPWIGGLDQTVTVPANTPLRFCAWSRIRISNVAIGKANSESVAAYNGRSKVGISPTGDGNGIVWSGEINPHDTWGQVCVEATSGPQGKVIVYTSNDWHGGAAVHVDAWWDDAELIVTGPQPTATPAAGNPVIQPTSAPVQVQPTVPPVTNPDGSIVHTVVSGDSLYAIAFQYNTTLEEILRLNNMSKSDLLSIGQKIVVKAGSGGQPAVQPTAAPGAQQPTPAGGVVTDTQPAAQPTGGTS
jgi:LysM repeat protein